MDSLCRFCAKPGSGIDVFGEEGQKRNLYSKIKLCLPINITMNDGMTTLICNSCIQKLNITYEFHTTSLSAQYHLRTMLETQDKFITTPQKKLDSNTNHLPENSCNKITTVLENDLNVPTQNTEHLLEANNFCGIKIEAVHSITANTFQNLKDADKVKIIGKRSLEEDKPDTAKKKERMTVCQYCMRWFPRSIITHHEKLHVKGSITFNCTSCNKDFSEADDFKNHRCEGD